MRRARRTCVGTLGSRQRDLTIASTGEKQSVFRIDNHTAVRPRARVIKPSADVAVGRADTKCAGAVLAVRRTEAADGEEDGNCAG